MDALTTIEADRLSTCEAVIERGLRTFYEVGAALEAAKESLKAVRAAYHETR